MRYRLAILGPNPLAVVRYAGGWIFDRVLAGWEVWVAVAECDDPRPVRILGAEVLDLESCLNSNPDARPQTLAVDTALFGSYSRIRNGLLDSLDTAEFEVALWGENWPAELDCRVGSPVQYRMSSAARAFKERAYSAALTSDPVDAVETFRVGSPSLAADLLPSG
ncbi:hypothetical protein [Nocardia jejuensis]|uniref:hypothetical protein n=1 Tax=Nocardia jejuensis TaxID=328049 RepID=UPI00083157E5|nr:hypothetical protein [Nocardia jejuensis]